MPDLSCNDTAVPACATSEGLKPGKQGKHLDAKLLSACIHCGLCLPACPTYLASGREMESPRGRIQLLSLLEKDELPFSARAFEHIDSCLGCLGCQTACPSGVNYGKILEQGRADMAHLRNKRARRFMRLAFSKVLPDYARLRKLGAALRLYQGLKLDKFLNAVPGLSRFGGFIERARTFLPAVPRYERLPAQSWMPGSKIGTVQLFSGCVMDIFYNHINHAAIRLLTRQRRVVSVPEQTCCGALAAHAGEIDIAKSLARRNIEHFNATEGQIVVTSAGCGAMLKSYGQLLADDKEWQDAASDFSARVADITEALAAEPMSGKRKAVPLSVAYHPACHLLHAQKIEDAPAKLLSEIEGVKTIKLEEAEQCCGSAGIFNLTHGELSDSILARKMANIKATGAQCVVTTNPGCLMQLTAGSQRNPDSKLKVAHLVEVLDQSFDTD